VHAATISVRLFLYDAGPPGTCPQHLPPDRGVAVCCSSFLGHPQIFLVDQVASALLET